MKTCAYHPFLPDYRDENLEPALRKKVRIHLRSCRSCRALLEETDAVVRVLRSAPKPDPGRAWMRRYHRELDAGLRSVAAGEKPVLSVFAKVRLFLASLRPALLAAGAAALLIVGILAGRFILPRSSGVSGNPQVLLFSARSPSESQWTDFLTESEIWMLAVVNYEPEEDPGSAYLALNRETAENLLRRSLILEKKGIEPDREGLIRFVQGMQMILLETTNSDEDAKRLVSDSRQSILEMRLLDRSRLLRRIVRESGSSGV
ncbi:zf-HC2 domain-containing protein [bacterium]|nr:zf-HC2 domain-containing protein [bacterium]